MIHRDKDIIVAFEHISLVIDQLRHHPHLQWHADLLEEACHDLLDAMISDISGWEQRCHAVQDRKENEASIGAPAPLAWKPIESYLSHP